ncbi:alpha/beta hydrolase [Stieleria sp. JC731]|uniref:alpha/beta hydrolase n=1 Tax=Pirellulaceae TaxID=2691357 RepID=UPI001E62F103|nr:alpha/beta hydrolase [Stieleria sp. JC731]MCC9603148.1 alpha/beta hydrolase [Stieleria sp. JC731]
MFRFTTALTIAALLSGAVFAQKGKTAKDKPNPDQKVVYKTVGGVELQLHVFKPKNEDVEHPRAAIVFFFGGGWVGGTPSQFYSQSRALADRGMVAFCAQYRVKKQHGTSPKECVEDGKSAMRWVRKHAAEFNVDPNRIAAGGGSAGGHVAAATATVDHFDAEGEDTTVSCQPNALALFNPVYDNGPDGYGYDRVKEYYKEISPIHNLDEDVPPTIVFLGTKDKLIPVSTGEAFRDKSKALGVRSELHLYKDAPHGFFNRDEAFDDTLEKTIAFFDSLGYLDN